ncbi:chorismate-binding protein [Pseudonocardia sp. ICBG1293]|uniref:chorismate-binding protein n=1 Tax=Pseudonocardia sp. ICBG1293 TaxID=2844382 RepID=UPI001CCC6255|nr:chorismate-binding protein [Pseudonocardia sp. ICBG1293]
MRDDQAPRGRFDDLVAGTGTRFDGVRRVLVAHRPSEVAPVLDEVDRLTRDGLWAFGFLAYEAAPGLDPGLTVPPPSDGLPLVWFGVVDRPEQVPPLTVDGPEVPALGWAADWDAADHRVAVERVRDRIAAGETYQCSLTTRLRAVPPAELDAEALYRELAHGQRGAHNAYLDLGRFVVASASPELFFEQRGDRILMRPMKGTADRGRTTAEDEATVARLHGSDKERAENVMIVDLVRNDLGRIAVPGSVRVTRLLAPERYATVHQLTSDVTAQLRPQIGLVETFRALFPCGSVTGAPKARTMELITELEPAARGVYCGAVGVVGPPTAPVRARFSVAIRTVVLDREQRRLGYGTGGGITWGSRPAAEYAELQAKARVLDARHLDFHLVETMHHDPARGLRNLDGHLGRMADSADYFDIPFDAAAARARLRAAVHGVGDARVRLRCHRDGALGVDVGAAPAPLGRPVRLAVAPEPLDTQSCWSRHTTSRRTPYDERLARHPEADDVVVVNERGELTGTCTANLALRIGGRWWTPPPDSGCLPGVERARLLAGGRLQERVLRPADLHRAERIEVVGSLRGRRPARMVPAPDAHSLPLPTGSSA